MPGEHYTTLTVAEYTHMVNVIKQLRWKIQKSRELIEVNRTGEALNLLKATEEESF